MNSMKIKNFIITGIIIGFIFLLLDMLFAIITNPLLLPYSDLPIWRIPPNILAGTVFDFINGFILVGVFMVIYKGVPGTGWKKGVNYGIIVGLFRVVMMSFSTIVMYAIPIEIVTVGLISGYIEIIILCIILSLICEKINPEKQLK